jgi:hypothetical protein
VLIAFAAMLVVKLIDVVRVSTLVVEELAVVEAKSVGSFRRLIRWKPVRQTHYING